MKKNIHPVLHQILVTDSTGKAEKMFSTKKQNLTLNTSKMQHPAWTGVQTILNDDSKKIEKMNQFF